MTNLRKIRKQERLTMKALAELSGVTESMIGMIETGKRNPSFEVLLRLSEALGCTVDELVRDSNEPKTEDEEIEELLQELRKREDLRALMNVGKRNTPEQIRRMIALMESMNEGSN